MSTENYVLIAGEDGYELVPAGQTAPGTPSGPRGSRLFPVTVPPVIADGDNGDFAVHVTTGQVWGPKAAGVWPEPFIIRGIPLLHAASHAANSADSLANVFAPASLVAFAEGLAAQLANAAISADLVVEAEARISGDVVLQQAIDAINLALGTSGSDEARFVAIETSVSQALALLATAAFVDDPRFTNARNPLPHALSHIEGNDLITAVQLGGLAAAARGAVNGVAPLDAGAVIPSIHLPPIALTNSTPVASEAAMLALVAQGGDIAIRTDVQKNFILRANGNPTVLADWYQLETPATVTSVDGRVGVVDISDRYVPKAIFDAAGDLLVGTGDNTYARVPAGGPGQVLSADGSGVLVWINPPAGSGGVVQVVGGVAPAELEFVRQAVDDVTTALLGKASVDDYRFSTLSGSTTPVAPPASPSPLSADVERTIADLMTAVDDLTAAVTGKAGVDDPRLTGTRIVRVTAAQLAAMNPQPTGVLFAVIG